MIRKSPRKKTLQQRDATRSVVRVAGYVRCSDEGQSVSDFNTLDNQKNVIAHYVEGQVGLGEPWELVGYYVDDGFSGKNLERPELSRLLRSVQSGEIDAVVVYKLDRITRSISDFFHIDRLMSEQECRLVSVKEHLDTSTPLGRLLRTILLAFAEMEREVNSERVRDKMLAEARLGRHLGGATPYGYDVLDRKLVPNPDEASVVKMIFAKYVETRSLATVRDYINGLGYRTRLRETKAGLRGGGKWTIQTLEKMIQNVRYKGTYAFEDIEIPESHEAIVDPEMWDLAQKVKAMRVRPARPKPAGFVGHTYLLQGLIDCDSCGTRMTPSIVDHRSKYHRNKPYTAYYECGRSHRYPAGEKCPVGRYNAERVEAAVLGRVWELEADPVALQTLLDTIDTCDEDIAARVRLDEVQEALRGVRTKIGNLVEAVASGQGIKTLEMRLRELEREETALATEATALQGQIGRDREPLDVEDVRRWFRDIRDLLKEATHEERKKIVGGLVRKVEPKSKEAVRVTYNVLPDLPPSELSSCLNQRWLPGVDSNHEPSG